MPQRNDLSIRQLEYIVALDDARGFRRAAERAHVSQPALSAQVKQLEDLLGAPLFERSSKGVLVTDAGRDVIARARGVLRALDDLLATAEIHRDPEAASLRVGVIPTIAPYLLPRAMPALRKALPKVRWAFREEKTDALVELVTRGDLDVAVVAKEAPLGDLEVREVGPDPFVLAACPSHPLAQRKKVSLDDLDGEEVLVLDEGHCLGDQARAICERVGAHEAEMRATSLPTLVEMVASGGGVTLLPTLALGTEDRGRQLTIVPFRSPAPARTLCLVSRASSPRGALLDTIARSLAASLRS
jgi:LysR family hydrogen peroxide-inducible transcriptional activator